MNIPLAKRLCEIIRVSCIALALFLFVTERLHAAPATQIFVLHSYSQEYAWTQGQHEGFMQALAADAKIDVAVSTEYLDTKRRDYDETYATEFARHLRVKYKGYRPAAIYVTDDNALLFARDHLSRVFPGTPVFFSAVNDYDVRKSLDPAVCTGVFELKEVAPNLEWLLRMDKGANDLVFIGDGSNTYQAIEREARKDIIPYHLRATFVAEKRLDLALARLRDLPGRYLFLTTLGGMTDANGQVLSLRDIMKSLVSTGRIVISMEDAYILEGVLGGYVTSGQHQGMSAARLLLLHLHGRPIADLPPILKSPNALIFDDRALHQYGINLPESLRAQAVLLNPHPGFYERYRSLILGSLIGLTVLLFLVVTAALVIMSRKNRELNLARNSAESANALFKQLAEQSRTVHWEVDDGGVYTYVSPVSYAVLGYLPEELVDRKHFYDLIPEEERDAKKTAAFEFFARKGPFHDLEHAARTKDGRLIWVVTNGIPVLDDHGTLRGYRGSDCDITERKKMDTVIRQSEEKFSKAFHLSPILTAISTIEEGRFLDVNETFLHTLLFSREEVVGRTSLELGLFADPLQRLAIREITEKKGYVKNVDTQMVTKHGQIIHGLFSAEPITFNNKNCWLTVMVDVTEQKRMAESLKQSEAQYRLLADHMNDQVWLMDLNLQPIYMSPSVEKLRGYTFEELKQLPIEKRLTATSLQSALEFFSVEMPKALADPTYFLTRSLELEFYRKDGSTVWLENTFSLIRDENGKPLSILGVGRNMTERMQADEERRGLEERLQRSEKMEALGQLAGGVAHDLNNILGILSGYSELLLDEIPEGSRSRGHVEKIFQSTEKGAAIIQDLLTLARRGVAVAEVINLNSVVSAFLKTPVFDKLKDYHPRVTFRTECDQNLLNINGSPVHLEKALMNLVSNAAEAISGTGAVMIRTESLYLDKPIRGYDDVKEGDYAVLTISDTGMGIPAKDREKIFEPFYTKKTMGRSGTGLGLAIVWGTVKDHNGYIDLRTEVGEGTTFTLYFPVTREELIAPQQKLPYAQYMGHGESVLVVDDIADQREIASRLIAKLGYHVHGVSSGEEAVEYLKRNKADILVLDMIMAPGIDGLETYERVLEINPGQKAIIVSGFSETERVRETQQLGAGAYVKKPYVTEKIGVAIRDELQRT